MSNTGAAALYQKPRNQLRPGHWTYYSNVFFWHSQSLPDWVNLFLGTSEPRFLMWFNQKGLWIHSAMLLHTALLHRLTVRWSMMAWNIWSFGLVIFEFETRGPSPDATHPVAFKNKTILRFTCTLLACWVYIIFFNRK